MASRKEMNHWSLDGYVSGVSLAMSSIMGHMQWPVQVKKSLTPVVTITAAVAKAVGRRSLGKMAAVMVVATGKTVKAVASGKRNLGRITEAVVAKAVGRKSLGKMAAVMVAEATGIRVATKTVVAGTKAVTTLVANVLKLATAVSWVTSTSK